MIYAIDAQQIQSDSFENGENNFENYWGNIQGSIEGQIVDDAKISRDFSIFEIERIYFEKLKNRLEKDFGYYVFAYQKDLNITTIKINISWKNPTVITPV